MARIHRLQTLCHCGGDSLDQSSKYGDFAMVGLDFHLEREIGCSAAGEELRTDRPLIGARPFQCPGNCTDMAGRPLSGSRNRPSACRHRPRRTTIWMRVRVLNLLWLRGGMLN